MCGIVGTVALNGGGLDEGDPARIEAAVGLMANRGPDGRGVESGANWMVGHTRLAIIDPARGRQPLVSRDGDFILVYNGEVYNFRELRGELAAAGHVFDTDCDTEVVLAAYRQWGADCLRRFVGFFALAVIDQGRGEVFLARDRLGVKPLHYSLDDNRLCFASTAAALMAAVGRRPEVDVEALSHYLSTGRTALGERTLLRGCLSMPPGHCLLVDWRGGTSRRQRYWRPPIVAAADKSTISLDEAIEQIRPMIDDAVKSRLVSDVPIGGFLSGGLDSAIVATLATRHLGAPPPFFCAGTDDEEGNEFVFAELVAARLGGRLERLTITADKFSERWGQLVAERGMPLSTPNEVAIFELAKALRRECPVALTGEGADEIFGGYVQPHFSAFDLDRCPRDPDTPANSSTFATAMLLAHGRSFFINDTDHYLATGTWCDFNTKAALFQDEVWEGIERDDAVFAFYEDYFAGLDGCSSFDKRLHLFTDFNLENLLSRVDSSTMAASVEARVPFTDHRLVEFAFQMPDHYKMTWRDAGAEKVGRELTAAIIDKKNLLETKILPRRAYAPELPPDVVARGKMSFPTPFEKWFGGPLADEIGELCRESELPRRFFRPETVELMLRGRNLWLLANLCKWWETIKTG